MEFSFFGGGVCPAYDYGKIAVCVEGYGYAVQRRPNIARLTYDMARYTSSVKKKWVTHFEPLCTDIERGIFRESSEYLFKLQGPQRTLEEWWKEIV